jgi:hypothetical protein
MIDFLGGALTLSFLIAGMFFFRFWRNTRDGLFLYFAIAFWLFTVGQTITTVLETQNERVGYVYTLRVAGYLIILFAIVRKNISAKQK